MSEVNPLFSFMSVWDLTHAEAGAFFDLDDDYIGKISRDVYSIPAWLMDFLTPPCTMSDAEIRRRVERAREQVKLEDPKRRHTRGKENPMKEWRKRKKLTQQQAATALGVHWASISAWELGDREIPERIMKILEEET